MKSATAFVLVMLTASGCGRRDVALLKTGALDGANVLLVTIDTLRRDRLGSYGNANGLTPTLDRLAGAGVRFTHAYSHVPMTLPAHTSILTGLIPPRHGIHNNVSFALDERVPTLATILKSRGYRTGAFVGAFVLDARFGLNHGFDRYDDQYAQLTGAVSFEFAERRAADVVKAAAEWITAGSSTAGDPGSERWFAWVHLFDPHAPYAAPSEYRAGRTPYDAEVAYTDAMLGEFFDRLRAAHALDRTLVVVTADHGESLGAHGETTHGLFAYNATLAVPLLISGASIPAGVVEASVAHVDIVPTVLDLVGVALPDHLDGRSLTGRVDDNRSIYFEALDANLTRDWAPLTGLVADRWKYINLPIPELYDISVDPDETTNSAARDAQRRDSLARLLKGLAAAPPMFALGPTIDTDAAERLRTLGYAGALTARRSAPYTEADDPKNLVALNEQFNTALMTFSAGRPDEALGLFLSLVRQRPDFISARTAAATVLLSETRAIEAVTILRQAPPAQAGSPDLLAKLGAALRDAGDPSGAAEAFERSRRAGDQNPDLFNDLGVVYARLGRVDDARAMFQELLKRDPNAAGTWFNIGMLELEHRQTNAAINAFRQAVRADPDYGDAWRWLGAALVDSHREEAIDAWTRAERLRPRDYDLLFNLGIVLAESRHPRDARPYLERFVREAPRDRYVRDIARVQATLAKIAR